MSIIKLPFKIIAIPFVVVLTVAVAFLRFLFCYAEMLLNLVSFLLVIIGAVTLVLDNTFNGIVILVLAFIISPLGLPRIADWLIDMIDNINYSLKNFIMS